MKTIRWLAVAAVLGAACASEDPCPGGELVDAGLDHGVIVCSWQCTMLAGDPVVYAWEVRLAEGSTFTAVPGSCFGP